jgi:hypothetical protein
MRFFPWNSGGIPVISGTAYPAETLTSTIAGQWYADDVAISGETGSTYVIGLDKIGAVIRCGESNTLTVWHPSDIAAVAAFWSPYFNVFTSVSPDVSATDGQAIRRWVDIISGIEANQTSGTLQPIYRATGQAGKPSLEYDGGNDCFTLPASSAIFKDKAQGYLMSGLRCTAPTGGNSQQGVISFSADVSFNSRLTLSARRSGNNFATDARRLDAEALAIAVTANDANYNVLVSHGDWSNGFARITHNETTTVSTALASSGNTSNTDSAAATIGREIGGAARVFAGHMTCACVVNAALSATERSQLARYLGLHGGTDSLNIPLV